MKTKIPYEAHLKLEIGTHSARINQLLVTPDGKSLITAGGDKTIRVWDVESKKQVSLLLGQIGAGADGSIQAIAISPNGKYLIALAWMYPDAAQDAQLRETDFRVYELATGNLQAGFRYPGTLQDLDFNLDGRYLALAGNPNATRQGLIMIHETKSILTGFGKVPVPVSSAVLYEHDLIPSYVRFIPEKRGRDGSYRVVAAPWEHWRSGAPEYSGRLTWFTFSASAPLMTTINLEIDVAPDCLTVGSQFAIVTAEETAETRSKNLYCYDHEGRLINIIESETFPARPAFSRDENQMIVGQRNDGAIVQVKVYDTAFGKFPLKSTYFGHDSTVLGTAILGDNTVVSAGGDQNAIHFWNTSHMEGEKTGEITGVGRVLHAAGINREEQIGFGYRDDLRLKDGRMVLQRAFDLRTMTLKTFPFQKADEFRRAQKVFNNQTLDFSERNRWNLQILPDGSYFGSSLGWYNVSTYGFTEDGAVAAGSPDGKIRLWPRSPEGLYASEHFLLGHESSVLDHASCGRWLVTVGADQVIRLWYLEDAGNSQRLEPALNLFAGSDDEWVVWSKSGYYNASQRGDRRFGYHINRGPNMESLFFPSDRFIKSFFRPDIIQTILATGSEERALEKLKSQGIPVEPVDVSRILPPIVELARNGITRQNDKITVKFTVGELDPKQPVTRVWIVQNDKFAWQAEKRAKAFKVTLPLRPGQNRFKILAETKNTKAMPLILDMMGPEPKTHKGGVLAGSGSTRGAEDTTRAVASSTFLETREPGRLFLLAVGVSEFSDVKSDVKFLKYADDDAAGIFNAFGKGDLTDWLDVRGRSETIRTETKNTAFESVEATLLTNQFATKKAILDAVQRICDEIVKRAKSKKPKRDVFMVFLSGHGVRLVGGPINDLYFWNYDAVFNDLEKTGLSFMELGEKVTCVPAEVILATDACHSGMAGRDVVREVDANELAKRIYAINERGLYILNAARSEEKAQEYDQINHGVFARSILDGLIKQANPEISMIGLMDFVQRQMKYYMGVKQTPVFRTYGDLLPLIIYNK